MSTCRALSLCLKLLQGLRVYDLSYSSQEPPEVDTILSLIL